ncbi:MAG: hypothetical protein AAGI23_00555 [Bacteroidota bacterium]
MKTYSTLDAIRLYVMKAQTQKALDELYTFLKATKVSDFIDQIIILSSNYNDIDKATTLGLGEYREEKNRINLALLKILTRLEADGHIEIKPQKSAPSSEQLDAIESKLDFILAHIERTDDLLFYGFQQSYLWKQLEEHSRELLTQASIIIIEKEGEQDRFKEAMHLLLEVMTHELEQKFFDCFKAKIEAQSITKEQFIDTLKGMNKGSLYSYVSGGASLSLHQMAEIINSNIFEVEKADLVDAGADFFDCFHSIYKIRHAATVRELLKKQKVLRLSKTIRGFTQTLTDLMQLKEDVIHLLTNLQPR